MSNDLTSDNLLLSRPKNECVKTPHYLDLQSAAFGAVSDEVASLVRNSVSDNTHRAYLSDLAHFKSWGGCIPTTDVAVASYLAAHAETSSVATLVRRLASISKAHAASGAVNPVRAELVRATLRGIKRQRGSASHQAKPLLQQDLFMVLDAIGNSIKDVRDRALLLTGFAGGFRRSELVAIDVSAVEFVRQGAIIVVTRSKTDQLGVGRKVGIPSGRKRHCPVAALEDWIGRADIRAGPVFRPVSRHGHVIGARLSAEAVSIVIKERAANAGFDPSKYSGHSLRAGLATSSARAGVPTWKIRAQTGHASDATLARYIRDGELFTNNAAGALL